MKRIVVLLVILSFALCGCGEATSSQPYVSNEDAIKANITEACEAYGIKVNNCEVEYYKTEKYDFGTYLYYNVCLDCNGFGGLSDKDAVALCRKIDNAGKTSTSRQTFSTSVWDAKIICGSDEYTFDLKTVSGQPDLIYKNKSEYIRIDSEKTNTVKTSAGIHTNAEAFTCAQDIVLKNLKAPSTAKFCKVTEATITHLGNEEYMVMGWVDSQNSYGATLRASFLVTYTAIKDGRDIGYKNASCSIIE